MGRKLNKTLVNKFEEAQKEEETLNFNQKRAPAKSLKNNLSVFNQTEEKPVVLSARTRKATMAPPKAFLAQPEEQKP